MTSGEVDALAAVLRSDLLEAVLSELGFGDVHLDELQVAFGRGRAAVLFRRQVDGAGGEIDREGDDAGNEKNEQAESVECDDRLVEAAAGRLAAALGMQDHAAASERGE